MHFGLEWSRAVVVTTAVVICFLCAQLALMLWLAYSSVGEPGLAVIYSGVAIGIFAILAVPFLLSPRGYVVNGNELVVRRILGQVVIPLQDIAGVASVSDPFKGSLRVCASGGLWGMFGLFSNSEGTFRAMATSTRNAVVVTTSGGARYVLSPRDRDRFVAALQGFVSSSADTSTSSDAR
jgi:hypothetical protein